MVSAAFALVAASGLVASVNAGSVHAHNHANLHKKAASSAWPASSANATCGCTTYTTTWYGEATLVPAPSTSSTSSSSTSTWAAPTTSISSSSSVPATTSSTSTSSSSSAPPPPPPTTSSSWSAPAPSSTWVAPSYSAPAKENWAPAPSSSASAQGGLLGGLLPSPSAPSWSAPAASASAASTSGGDASITANGDKWAMTYTPYDNSGGCKSASDVATDIAAIKAKGFTCVRLYATDCSGVQNVGSAAKQNGLKLIMGIYLDASGLSNGYAQISTLTSWGSDNGWDNVEMVVAGNEAIFNNYVSASELAGFIGDVKTQFKTAGFTGPVTTTETLNIIQENSAVLCPAVDVIAANIHPFFNDAITATGAGDFVSSQLSLLAQACNNEKDAYNLETGWPSAGDANGAAVPGTWEQQTAIDSIVASAGGKSAIFSFENDGWKAPGDLGVEQFWGCANIFKDLF